MKNHRTPRFLKISLICVVLLCVIVFSSLALFMERQSSETINQVGGLYMESMCEQISRYFETTIEMRLNQVSMLTEETWSEDAEQLQQVRQRMESNARDCDFTHLALLSEDGQFEMFYGEPLRIADPVSYLSSLNAGERKAALGYDSTGSSVVLLGVPCEYLMTDGQECTAMVAGIPVSYINEALSLNVSDDEAYSFIIRKDGSFVLCTDDVVRGNYFDRALDLYDDVEKKPPKMYVEELKQAMGEETDYSTSLSMNGVRRHMFCTKLSYSEWYLLTFLPYGDLDRTIDSLGQKWIRAAFVSCTVILLVLLVVFAVYLYMTWRQLRDLDYARQEAERANKAKSEFLSNMSHDIRTPMNAIVGMTAIATAHIDNQEQVHNCLKKIALSGKHLLGLINDVLDMSKIESGKMTLTLERISLQEVFDGIVSIVQTQIKGKGQNLNVHITDIEAEDVYCDGVRLNQVLLNLLSNAVKYTQEGGTIQLSLYQEEAPQEKGSDYVRTHVLVKDNGIGMTKEFLTHIFDSYSRADSKRVQKTEGAGLGMAITKYIVDAMGGELLVESEPQKGTEFHLILDLQKADIMEVDMVLPAWKMLVVDDDETLCRTAVDALESIGIQADWTLSGQKAIELVTKHHKMRDDYQIVMLDWKLADMNGLTVARQIRKIMEVDMPIILISAYDWSEFEAEAKEAGITGFISKPLFKSTLFYGLKRYMGIEEEENAEADMDLAGRHVLVAEDNDLNWEILNELLTDFGMELDWAENGKICLEKFQESEPGYYDVILMDVRMPIMNGYESTMAIRSLNRSDAKEIPIIAMTADAFAEDIKRCLDSGMNAHTAKPINLDEVFSLLNRFIK